jgi:iduronate 2-sulfatase
MPFLYIAGIELVHSIDGGAKLLPATPNPSNLLFIMFDDLKPELFAYGRRYMSTPNFDRLVNRSVLFERAYTHIAVCAPARDALLTGLRPDTVGSYGFAESYLPHVGLPSELQRMGWNTARVGKVEHRLSESRDVWSHSAWPSGEEWYDFQHAEMKKMNASVRGIATNNPNPTVFRDIEIARRAQLALQSLARLPEPFFLAVGFKNPHLQYLLPNAFLDMYPPSRVLPGYSNGRVQHPTDFGFPPTIGAHEFRAADFKGSVVHRYADHPRPRKHPLGPGKPPIPAAAVAEIKGAYAASVSFVDAQLGRLLDQVDALDLWPNLTVVLTSDHGMHNGELGIFGKVPFAPLFRCCVSHCMPIALLYSTPLHSIHSIQLKFNPIQLALHLPHWIPRYQNLSSGPSSSRPPTYP